MWITLCKKLFFWCILVIARLYELSNVDLSNYSTTSHQDQGYCTTENQNRILASTERNLCPDFSISFTWWTRLLWMKSNKSQGPVFTTLTIWLYIPKCHFCLPTLRMFLKTLHSLSKCHNVNKPHDSRFLSINSHWGILATLTVHRTY